MSASIGSLSETAQPGLLPGSGATPDTYSRTQRRSRMIKTSWDAYFKGYLSKLEAQERMYDYQVYEDALRCRSYYEGDFNFRVSQRSGQMRDLRHSDKDPKRNHNYYQYYVDLSIAAALEAKPEIVVDPAKSDDDEATYTAKSVQGLCNYIDREVIDPDVSLDNEKTRELDGGVWWYWYWSMDAGELYAPKPIFEKKNSVLGKSAFTCQCGAMGDANRITNGVCPECRRNNGLKFLQAPIGEIEEISGYEKERIGFPVLEVVSSLQMHADRKGKDYLSGTFIERYRLIDKDVIAEKFPWWSPEHAAPGDRGDFGIQAQEMSRRPNGSKFGRYYTPLSFLDSGDSNDALVRQYWLQPAKYAFVEFDEDQEFVGEETTVVPAHTRLGEVFPNGLYFFQVGIELLDHRGEDGRKHWWYTPYVKQLGKPDGKGQKDACDPQREIIDLRSLLFTRFKMQTGGMPTIIKPPLTETPYNGSPAQIVRLPFATPGNLQDYIYQGQYPPVDNAPFDYLNGSVNEMQTFTQTISPIGMGQQGQDSANDAVATAWRITNARIQGLMGPKAMPAAIAKYRFMLAAIDMFREYLPEQDIPIPLKGAAANGRTDWSKINRSDLEADFVMYIRPNSWLPHPREELQGALERAFQNFGQVLMDPNAPEILKTKIIEAYSLGLDFKSEDAEGRDANLRIKSLEYLIPQAINLAKMQINQMALSGNMIPSQPQPNQAVLAGQILASMVPVDQLLDDPKSHMDVYKSWLRGDEGRNANPILRAAIRQQYQQYQQMAQQAMQQMIQQQSAPDVAKQQMKDQGAQALEKLKQQGDLTASRQRVSESIQMKDLPPGGKIQMAAQAGIKLDPQEVGLKEAAEVEATKKPQPAPQIPEAPELDNSVRDASVQANLEAQKDELEHRNRLVEKQVDHQHRMKEMGYKALVDAATRPAIPPGAQTIKAPTLRPTV